MFVKNRKICTFSSKRDYGRFLITVNRYLLTFFFRGTAQCNPEAASRGERSAAPFPLGSNYLKCKWLDSGRLVRVRGRGSVARARMAQSARKIVAVQSFGFARIDHLGPSMRSFMARMWATGRPCAPDPKPIALRQDWIGTAGKWECWNQVRVRDSFAAA